MVLASREVAPAKGLPLLRRSGRVTELLFLYECATREVNQLRSVADRLGLTVQAASHVFRQLARSRRAEFLDGRYRPTVAGVAWLHETLDTLRHDVEDRLGRLQVVRSTRAVALADLRDDALVTLDLDEGMLVARPGGSRGSTGRTAGPARRGDVVLVRQLEGILPLQAAPVTILTFPAPEVNQARLRARIRQELSRHPLGLVAAHGLEAFHLVRHATKGPVQRFGVPAALEEASRVGVPSVVVVPKEELPRLLEGFAASRPPPFVITDLSGRGGTRRRGRRR
jgi:predicted transcriptional regulator